ncbi:MAG TPA: tetratricopeptide repeat protein [Longimicrobiaceae bacterium]|nr:tetratricopeptide repeat protein [Longimicrobiaceae bacterium]
MKPRRSDSPQRKPRRRWRWHIPPAIVRGPEALEGTEVLDDFGGELGLVLWQSLRDISLWSSITPHDARAGLFSPNAGKRRAASLLAADPDPRISGALATIAGILEDPAGTSTEVVMLACREVSQWAEDEGLSATALAFAQAAALASPGNAAAGFRVGLLARRRGEYARAETWFRRTIGLARQSRDWLSYAMAFNSLGNLYAMRGNLPVARQLQIRAYRAAKRHSLRPTLAMVLHDLFVIAVRANQHEEAAALARSAFDAYDPENPQFPAFAHDVAYFWMSHGQFAPALSVFNALLPQLRRPLDRIGVLGSIARAAGGVGDLTAYAGARDALWKHVHASESLEISADALLDLAAGATSLGRWAEAEEASRMAEQMATERQQAQIMFNAQSALEAIRSERSAEANVAAQPAEDVDNLATELVRTLEEYAVAG